MLMMRKPCVSLCSSSAAKPGSIASNDIVSAPPAKAAIPVNSPTISRMPTVVSAIATTFATHG